jgi:acyl carrier protein
LPILINAMYNPENVFKKVTEIITEKLGIPESEVTPDASFVRDLGIDSLDYAELVMEFEQTFDIKIPDDDAERMNTIGSAVEYIKSKIEAAK